MKVENIMKLDVKCCTESDSLNRAAQLMWENDCGFVPVVAPDGPLPKLVGVLTDRDICIAAYTQGKRLSEIPASSAMAHKIISCRPSDDVRQAEALMKENQVRRLLVTDENGALLGVVSINDLALEAEYEVAAKSGKPELSQTDVAATLAAICRHRGTESVQQAA